MYRSIVILLWQINFPAGLFKNSRLSLALPRLHRSSIQTLASTSQVLPLSALKTASLLLDFRAKWVNCLPQKSRHSSTTCRLCRLSLAATNSARLVPLLGKTLTSKNPQSRQCGNSVLPCFFYV